ncbi:MAG TPA: DUF2911 domain-containing protein [Bryobacteraceae bacterium]|nr:DUF2911 domain-containing protein [Bryobacteraceae bacterium]
MKTLLCVAIALAVPLAAETGNRKITANNKLSPPAETSMTLGAQTITIEYNAPSARGRKVEGGLIPYGSVWRLGADAATTLTTTGDIMIGNLRVPKGVHTLYLAGAEGSAWKLIVNKQTGQWGTEYSEAQDLGRVDMKVTKLSAPVEKLNIALKPGTGSSGTLEVEWGNSRAVVPIRVAGA